MADVVAASKDGRRSSSEYGSDATSDVCGDGR